MLITLENAKTRGNIIIDYDDILAIIDKIRYAKGEDQCHSEIHMKNSTLILYSSETSKEIFDRIKLIKDIKEIL